MRKTLLMLVVLVLLAAPAMAAIPAAGAASSNAFNPYGWAVRINVAPTPQPMVWVVIPGGAFNNSTTNARADAIRNTINTLAPLLGDVGNVGAINYKYVGGSIGDYIVFVTGVQAGSGSIADHKLITVDSHLAKFYGVSRATLARFLTYRLRGMAQLNSMGDGLNDVTQPNQRALLSPWNIVTY